jgi:hypothetical protein
MLMRVRRRRRQLAGALAVAVVVVGLAGLAVSPSASASPTRTAAHTAETAGKPSFADQAYNPAFRHPGVAITVAAGDEGYGVSYPASTQFVTSVGGTTLVPATGKSGAWTESAWSGTGPGARPSRPSPRGRPSTTPRPTAA